MSGHLSSKLATFCWMPTPNLVLHIARLCAPCLQTKSFDITVGGFKRVEYSTELFASRPPLIFGSLVVTPASQVETVLMQDSIASFSIAQWTPKIFVVSHDSCTNFVFKESTDRSASMKIVALHVENRKQKLLLLQPPAAAPAYSHPSMIYPNAGFGSWQLPSMPVLWFVHCLQDTLKP